MNGNDLMNALSGLDPKFIDEAAYELHEVNAAGEKKEALDTAGENEVSGMTDKTDNSVGRGNVTEFRSRNSFRKFICIALPSVAAILLIVGVALPAIMRVSKNESAAMMTENAAPASEEAAAEAPAAAESDEAVAEAADEEAVAEAAGEATADEASYDNAPAEEPSAYGEEVAVPDAADLQQNDKRSLNADINAPVNAETSAKTDAAKDVESEAPAMEDIAEEAAPAAVAEEAESEEAVAEAEEELLVINSAAYAKGMLTLDISGMTPEEISGMTCNIEKTMSGMTVLTYKAGTVSDLMTKTAPLTLDITKLKLTAGTYKVTIGNVSADFTVK